jgi:hypothetical protein
MDGFIDLPVGTEFGYDGKRYQVIEAPDPGRCEGCTDEFREGITNLCKVLTCVGCERHDKIDVIVIEKEESNE